MALSAKIDPRTQLADLQRSGANLLTDDGFEAAVIISIFTHRRAEDTDDLPDQSGDRLGWWGDAYARTAGDKLGSRMWLLRRRQLSDDVVNLARDYLAECLQWMLDDGVVDEVLVETWRTGDQLGFVIQLPRPRSSTARYQRTWEMRLDAF